MPKPLGYVRLSIAELGLFIIENGTTDADLAAAVRKWHKALATQNAALEPFAAGQIAEAQGFAEEQRRKALAGHEARKEREQRQAPEAPAAAQPKNDDQAKVAEPLPNPAEPLPKQTNKQAYKQGGGEAHAPRAAPTPSDVEREEGRDPLRAAVVEQFGTRGIGPALRDLRAMGATPETLRKVVVIADRQWDGRAFGPDAIVKHWQRLVLKIPNDPKVCGHGRTANCLDCAIEQGGGIDGFGPPPEDFFKEVSRKIGVVR